MRVRIPHVPFGCMAKLVKRAVWKTVPEAAGFDGSNPSAPISQAKQYGKERSSIMKAVEDAMLNGTGLCREIGQIRKEETDA